MVVNCKLCHKQGLCTMSKLYFNFIRSIQIKLCFFNLLTLKFIVFKCYTTLNITLIPVGSWNSAKMYRMSESWDIFLKEHLSQFVNFSHRLSLFRCFISHEVSFFLKIFSVCILFKTLCLLRDKNVLSDFRRKSVKL